MSLKLNTVCKALAVAGLVGVAASAYAAGEVEVLHWWTSGGEAKSVGELKKMLQGQGYAWKDFAVAGGGGDNAMTVLKSRVVSGNPPAAAQIKGPAIQEWAAEGGVADITSVATANNWDKVLPPVVSKGMKYQGKYVAAPVNVHRVNWAWYSKALLDKYNGGKVPATWDDFFKYVDALKKAGVEAPVAHGGQDWQDFTSFESVVLGVGGAKFYNDALVKLDQKALTSGTMLKSLETFKKLHSYIDKGSSGRDWNLATAMVIQGKGGVQLMGDWAKGEFTAASKAPGKDYVCAPAPGTANAYTFNVDSFVMFKQKSADNTKAQNALAADILSPEFQEIFNLNKGSIPVRTDAKMDKFDDCAKLSNKDFLATSKTGGLVPSIAHGMAVSPAAAGAIKDAVSNFWNTDGMSAKDAQAKIAQAAQTK